MIRLKTDKVVVILTNIPFQFEEQEVQQTPAFMSFS